MASSPYGSIVGGGAFAGVDQGIDFTGGPFNIFAPAPGTISRVDYGSGWPGEGHLVVETLDAPIGPHRAIYFAEDLEPGVKQGQHVSAGQAIAQASGSGRAPGIEIGWALPSSGIPEAPLPPPRPANQWTAQGQSFQDWVVHNPTTGKPSGGGGGGGIVGGWLNRHGLPSWLVGGSGSGNAAGSIVNVPSEVTGGALPKAADPSKLASIDTIGKALAAVFSVRGLEVLGGFVLIILGVLWLARGQLPAAVRPGGAGAA